jgi:hypothetical protein
MSHVNSTNVLKVLPGDTMELAQHRLTPVEWKPEDLVNCPGGRGMCSKADMTIAQPGPLFVHLSKVPRGQDVRSYDGSGEWIKIYTLGVERRKEGETGTTAPLGFPQRLQSTS